MTTPRSAPFSRENLTADLRSALQPHNLTISLSAGVIIGTLQVAQAASFASLIFNASLSSHLARGLGMALFAATVALVVITLLTSLPMIIGGPQNVPAAIIGVSAAAIAAGVSGTEQQLATVLVVILLATLATGLFLLGLGTFRLAGLVRFLPYPVVGGFLAGTGWLMVTGGISSMAGIPFSLGAIPTLFEPDLLVYWLPGFLLGILILILSRRVRHSLFMPLTIVGIIVLFYTVVRLMGLSLVEVEAQGWLLGPFPTGGVWQPLMPEELSQVDWNAVGGQIPNILTAVFMSGIALLLNSTALELLSNRDIDLNREMRAAGWTNLVASLGSGMTGYQQLGLSTLNFQIGSPNRLAGLVAAIVCAGVLLFGGQLLGLIPKLVFGAFLVYMGLSFLKEWAFDARSRLHRIDRVVILLIIVVIATAGFLEGVIVGVLTAVILFIVDYSGVNVIKHALSALNYRSRVTRPPQQIEILGDAGEQIYILQLQGYLFFGTAHNLLEHMRGQLERPRGQPLRYLLLDFSRVTGVDSTALFSFSKIEQLAQANVLFLIFTNLVPEIHNQLAVAGLAGGKESVLFFDTLDRALEWCEDRVLEECGCHPRDKLPPLRQQLIDLVGQSSSVDLLMPYLERMELPANAVLMRKGDSPDKMYFIESGQITAQIQRENGAILRLETMMGGRVVGELGFYLGKMRTADVIAELPSVVYALDRATLDRMEVENPDASSMLHRLIIRLLSERVTHLVGTVDALQT